GVRRRGVARRAGAALRGVAVRALDGRARPRARPAWARALGAHRRGRGSLLCRARRKRRRGRARRRSGRRPRRRRCEPPPVRWDHRRSARSGHGALRVGGARRRGRADVSRLVLVRHAEPAEDARGLCYGSLDVGLSAEGTRHAAELAAVLAGVKCDAVYTSPRMRALDTARPIAAAHELAPVVVDDPREIDFGDFEGRRYEEIEQTEPELYRAWMATPTRVRFPGGES